MESTNQWVQLIAVILGGGAISAIVQVIATHRKVGADANATFVTASNDQRRSLAEDADRYRKERDEEHARANALDWKLRDWWARADRFMIWARRQDARNRENGVDDPMPDLFPTPDSQ
jgi:hypothetical protein